MIKNRDYAIKRRSLGPGETERALYKLEESYLESNAKHHKLNITRLNDASLDGSMSLGKGGVGRSLALNLPKI